MFAVPLVMASALSVQAQVPAPAFVKIVDSASATAIGSIKGFEHGQVLVGATLRDGRRGFFLGDGQSLDRVPDTTPASPDYVSPPWPGGDLIDMQLDPGGLVGVGTWSSGGEDSGSALFALVGVGWELQATAYSRCPDVYGCQIYPFSAVGFGAWSDSEFVLGGRVGQNIGLYVASSYTPFLEQGMRLPNGHVVTAISDVQAIPGGEAILLRVSDGAASGAELYLRRAGALTLVATLPSPMTTPAGSGATSAYGVASSGLVSAFEVQHTLEGGYENWITVVYGNGARVITTAGPSAGVSVQDVMHPAVDGTDVAYLGRINGVNFGIFVRKESGQDVAVVVPGMQFDGKTVRSASYLRPTFRNGRIAARVEFTDNSFGVYVVTVPAPAAAGAPVPALNVWTLVLLASALTLLAGRGLGGRAGAGAG